MRVLLASAAAFGGGVLVGVYLGFWLMTRPEYVTAGSESWPSHPRDDDEPPFA